ncbi:ImmA/IrrE family metallo-endopeptidase [Streptomyces sp. NPDC058947]|uniref:ImmA/IrrE family metallo-endopeptidase n=1 Tax=Streptomyces sp. NPDC058947 TaxID=3346675 RepID=UPI0036879A0D
MLTPAQQAAHKLLNRHEIEKPPIPIEEIARAEGILITRKAFDGTRSGFALRDGATRIIGINSATSPRRQRFTVAHELGHLFLHQGKPLIVDHSVRVDWRDERSSLGTDKEEMEANAFAAEVLMPVNLILDRASHYLRTQNATRESLIAGLARDFDVSAEAMGYRLINLGIIV